MNGLEFAASVIDSLAWPIVAIVAIYVLKSPISAAIRDLKRFRYKDLDIEIAKEIEAIEKAAEELPPASTSPPAAKGEEQVPAASTQESVGEIIGAMAEEQPGAAVALASVELEHAIIDATHRLLGIRTQRATWCALELFKEKHIDREHYQLFNRIWRVRSQVMHSSSTVLESDEALSLSRVALELAAYFKALRPKDDRDSLEW